ncbi:MAG: AAA family ATPase [Candidatus Eisenbacteria bacterium]
MSETQPQALDAERSVLAAMMLDRDAVDAAVELLEPSSFYRSAHGKVFAAVVALHGRDEPADLVTVSEELTKRGELEAAGGPSALAQLMESAVTAANVRSHARLVASKARSRALLRAASSLIEAAHGHDDPVVVAAEFSRELERLSASGSSGVAAALERSQFTALTAEDEPESLIGNGLLCRGDLGLLAGKPGLGKSRVALELAEACARGEDWLGLPTSDEPMRVLYVATEFTLFRWRQRCVQLFGSGDAVPVKAVELDQAFGRLVLSHGDGALMAIAGDRLSEPLCLLSDVGALELERVIAEQRIGLVVLDPLARLMDGQDETNENFGALVQRLDRIRFRTRSAVLLVHHDRKGGTEAKAKDVDPLDAIRGGSVLTTSANTVMHLSRSQGGAIRLTFPKANYAAQPDDMWLNVPANGGRTVRQQSPEQKVSGTRERVLAWARRQVGYFTAKQAGPELGMTPRGVRDHLQVLAAEGLLVEHIGSRNNLSWSNPSGTGNDGENNALSPWDVE